MWTDCPWCGYLTVLDEFEDQHGDIHFRCRECGNRDRPEDEYGLDQVEASVERELPGQVSHGA